MSNSSDEGKVIDDDDQEVKREDSIPPSKSVQNQPLPEDIRNSSDEEKANDSDDDQEVKREDSIPPSKSVLNQPLPGDIRNSSDEEKANDSDDDQEVKREDSIPPSKSVLNQPLPGDIRNSSDEEKANDSDDDQEVKREDSIPPSKSVQNQPLPGDRNSIDKTIDDAVSAIRQKEDASLAALNNDSLAARRERFDLLKRKEDFAKEETGRKWAKYVPKSKVPKKTNVGYRRGAPSPEGEYCRPHGPAPRREDEDDGIA